MREIEGETLTTFEIDEDGARFRINVADKNGEAASLGLPTECLTQLVMTLPRMAEVALRTRHNDETLRIVYPLHESRVELSHRQDALILTLGTSEGFEVSFSIDAEILQGLQEDLSMAEPRGEPGVLAN